MFHTQKYTPPHCFFWNFPGWEGNLQKKEKEEKEKNKQNLKS